LIMRSLKQFFLSLSLLALPGALISTAASGATGDLAHGEEVYEKRCSQCHGETGKADGPGASRGYPRPRPFANNTMFKIRSTPVGALPTDDDLFNIISRGLGGTTMPPFDVIPEQDRWDVVAYIKTLTEEFADPEYLAEAQPIAEVASASPTPSTPESMEQGKALFEENCVKCHGLHGLGNGEQRTASSMKDKWFSLRMLPANLANPESYRGGSTATDIFRSITTGLDGTPMPSHLELLNAEERWAVTHYVMGFHPLQKDTRDAKVAASQLETLPTDGQDPAWDTLESFRFQMVPNIVTPPRNFWPAVEFVNVKAVYNETEIAFRVQWDDRDQSTGDNVDFEYQDGDTEIYWETDHPDQIAMLFPAKQDDVARPYFLMGDRKKAVNMWWWRGDTDTLQEINAKGYGNFTTQGEGEQDLHGQVTYEDGRYSLYVRRALSTDGKGDIQFEPGRFEPIAFNIWDGGRAEVGNRRNLTSWFWLYLEPTTPQSAYVRPPFFFLFTLLVLGLIVRKNKVRAESGDFDNLAPLPVDEIEGLLTRLFKKKAVDEDDAETEEVHHHDDHHHALHWSQWPEDGDMGHASQGKIGMWLFLLSDCFSFSGLLLGYGIIRAGVDVWHCTPEVLAAGIECGPVEPEFGLGFTAALTFLLICSSVSMVLAIGACMENKRKEMLIWLGTTIFFGAFFLLGQFKEYWGLPGLGHMIEPIHHGFGEWLHHGLTDEGITWGESHRSTTFYLITGFHGLHVSTGVGLLIWTWAKAYRGDFNNGDYNFMEIIGLFWHFVDLVWIVVFTLVYLIPANPGLH
jgi:DMSO reductase family type II enzyme heme b subunit